MSTPVQSSTPGGILRLKLVDKESLHKAYMPFLKSGGVFVPTSSRFKLGSEVFLLLVLPEENEPRPVPGKVAWVSAAASGGRPAGIGIQFSETPTTDALRTRIDVLLAGYADKERSTNTM